MKNIVIIFGGKSGEHEVSVKSALAIEKNIDKNLFSTSVIGISLSGNWTSGQKVDEVIKNDKVISANGNTLPTDDIVRKLLDADIVFPIIHGPNGEDGTIQGLLEIANVAYVGSGVLGSSICMDKVIQKQLCAQAGIPQPKFVFFNRLEWNENEEKVFSKIISDLSFPLFTKPANLGSSVGISKAKTKEELHNSINTALEFDHKIIVEQAVENMLEIEVSVMGNNRPRASVCGSLEPNAEFYDYETKYITDDIQAAIPAKIDIKNSEKIKSLAIKAYTKLNCFSLARVDFFLKKKTGEVLLNEINTLPGFTKISMYPKLWEASNLSFTDLITKLINFAENRFKQKQKLKTNI